MSYDDDDDGVQNDMCQVAFTFDVSNGEWDGMWVWTVEPALALGDPVCRHRFRYDATVSAANWTPQIALGECTCKNGRS